MKMHPFLALILAALGYGIASGMAPLEVVETINKGFGGTIGYIGIVILAGTIIGTFLERSGAAQSLAEAVLKLTGRKNVPLTMGAVGYVVSMPVFCDSAYAVIAISRNWKIRLFSGKSGLELTKMGKGDLAGPTTKN